MVVVVIELVEVEEEIQQHLTVSLIISGGGGEAMGGLLSGSSRRE